MSVSESVRVLEGLREGTDWVSKVRLNPSRHGQSARTVPLLVSMISRYKTGKFGSQLAVYEYTTNGQKRFFATDQRTIKNALSGADEFRLAGHVIPQRRVGQEPTWVSKR